MSLMTPESGPVLAAYLAVMRAIRAALDRTSLLERWTAYATENPGSLLAHLRTLLAVHNASDLVRLDLPWWTYEAIDVVDAFLAGRPEARVFEYGSGASTLWLARRAASVDSVEHHSAWAGQVEDLLSSTDDLMSRPRLHIPPVAPSHTPRVASASPRGRGLEWGGYVDVIDEVEGPLDLILVDGRAREACLLRALDRVADDGLVLLDDAQRKRYRAALATAESRGWDVLRTRGATPCQPLPRETVLLTRRPADG